MDILVGLIVSGAVLLLIGWAIFSLAQMPGRRRLDALDMSLRELNQRIATLERRLDSKLPAEAAHVTPLVAPTPEPRGAARTPPGLAPQPAEPAVPTQLPIHPSPPGTPHPPGSLGSYAPLVTLRTPGAPGTPGTPVTASTAPPRRDVSLETFLGGRVMLIAGVIVGLFGVAFFLKYMIDHGWIGPAARVAMGGVTGIALLLGGDRLRRRHYDVFGQALMGCGLGAVYLSNYFACTRYGFFNQGGAFLVTAAITAVGATLAVRRRAPALAYLGFLGGFLAPALLATSRGELGSLTAWLLVVDAGVLAVLVLRAWQGLDLMALAAAVIYFSAWFSRSAGSADPVGASGYLAALVAASLGLALVPPIVRRERPGVASVGGAALAGVFGVVAAHALLFPAWRRELGAAVLGLGAAYFVASRLVASRAPAAREESAGLLGLSVAALGTAIAVALSGNAVPLALCATGVAVVFAGTRTRQQVLLGGGVGMVGLAIAYLLRNRLDLFSSVETPFLNERFALFASPCLALLLCAWLMSRVKDLPPGPSMAVTMAGLWALPLVVCADLMSGAIDSGDARFELRLAATTAVLAVYGAVVARLFGAARGASGLHAQGQDASGHNASGQNVSAQHAPGQAAPARFSAFGPIALALFFGLWLAFAGHRTPFTPGWSATFAAGLVLVAACLVAASVVAESARGLLATIPLIYLLVLITAEIGAWGQQRPLDGFTRSEAEFVAMVWISIAWALYAAALVGIGFWKQRAALRWLGLAVFALTIGKVFLADLAGLQPVYRIGSFLVLGALLVAASFLYQRARRSDETPA